MSVLAQAQEQLQAACGAAWTRLLREFTAAHHAAFRQAVAAVAQLDALQALAVVASSPGYCRPQVGCCWLVLTPPQNERLHASDALLQADSFACFSCARKRACTPFVASKFWSRLLETGAVWRPPLAKLLPRIGTGMGWGSCQQDILLLLLLPLCGTSFASIYEQFVEEGEPQQLTITEGKHPMLDLALDGTAVANSLNLTWDVTRAAIITGCVCDVVWCTTEQAGRGGRRGGASAPYGDIVATSTGARQREWGREGNVGEGRSSQERVTADTPLHVLIPPPTHTGQTWEARVC